MFRGLLAFVLMAAPTAAVTATADESDGWGLSAMPNGCMVQAVSPGGTMISIWGFAGEGKIAFLLQNPEWSSIRDGTSYDIKVDFLGVRTMPVDATAKQNIDSDGPGFFFTVEPGATSGNGFIDAFSTASGMRILQDGRDVDTLPLAGGRGAMASLAKCLAEKWNAGLPTAEAGEENEALSEAAGFAI
jgi:hypothetical protein